MATQSAPVALDAAEVQSLVTSGADIKILDVRTPAEFETAHIPGSYNVPLHELPEHRDELRGMGGTVVLVCQSGVRARQAEDVLREGGPARLHMLTGGIESWSAAGLELKRGQQRWSLERQVRAIAGALVLIGTLVSYFVWPPAIFLAMFVGGGLLFAGVTDTCMMAILLARLPYNQAGRTDVRQVVAQLASSRA